MASLKKKKYQAISSVFLVHKILQSKSKSSFRIEGFVTPSALQL